MTGGIIWIHFSTFIFAFSVTGIYYLHNHGNIEVKNIPEEIHIHITHRCTIRKTKIREREKDREELRYSDNEELYGITN